MPADVVIVLGFERVDFKKFQKTFGLKFDEKTERILNEDRLEEVNRCLIEAQILSLKEHGYSVKSQKNDYTVTYKGKPIGTRAFNGIKYYAEDMELEQTVLGVGLTGRYIGFFLDVDFSHGAGGVNLTPKRQSMLKRFQEIVSTKYPGFEAAYICVVPVWY